MRIEKNKIDTNDTTKLNLINTDFSEKEQVFSLTLYSDGQNIEAEKRIFISDENHTQEQYFMLKIIDALLASLQPTFVNNGCILHENSYENLRQAFYMFPMLEMSSAFLTGKNKVEFSYNVFQGKINSNKVTLVESTFEKEDIPAPTVLYLTICFLKRIYNIKTKEQIDSFINYLNDLR